MAKYLYHYTDAAGIDGIHQTGQILMSTDTGRDACLGWGVYLTDLDPGQTNQRLLVNNYGNHWPGQDSKVEYYVQIRCDELPGICSKRIGDRLIYIYPNDIFLDRVYHTIHKRR